MGWRYLVIVLGGMTLFIFFLRFAVFKFHESPKFLLSKGKEQEAIDVLHRIAKFNKQPPPQLTVEHFHAIDLDAGVEMHEIQNKKALNWRESTKRAGANFKDSMFKLTGLFKNRIQTFIFCLLAIVYMVRPRSSSACGGNTELIRIGRLLVIQLGWVFPSDHPATNQHIGRSRIR